ncbi:4-(cytidine 5'-diphospho)-2-C-methyl-D-erythritol kinase [Halomonas sp. HNIBRBA4712]|uniref:4-(cytidine 5'-diphospho)-2-C-methyl-D-erythritol kinase n=1 Tax=Halomonas sp. HNIBRBA4712 TaxID=3373087 RepID=UPI00374632CF
MSNAPTPGPLTLLAPAKLNRLLHITGRREDGYHTLQTLFQLVDLTDSITLTLRDDGEITLSKPVEGVPFDDNLMVRAARKLYPYRRDSRLGVTLAIDKCLPMGGGLGGGSSNAATVLLGLNRLWGLGLSNERLADIGLALGADVPVFVHGHSAWAEGVGERLTPVTLDTPWFVVIHPGVSVSTPAIFQDPELTRASRPITMARALQGGAATWRNDCEDTVKKRYPPIACALEWLEQFAPARVTGTGACLFATFANEDAARSVADQAGQRYKTWVARGLNTSPLHDALGR